MATPSFNTLRAALESAPDASVGFSLPAGPIPSGFHLTEFKRVQADSVDCGGAQHRWFEAVIELLGDRHGDPISARKLLGIAERIESHLPGFGELPLYIEYAPHDGTVQRHAVSGVSSVRGQIDVTLSNTRGECKASTRAAVAGAASCCAPPDAGDGCCGQAATGCC